MTSLQLTMSLWLSLLAIAASSDVASRRIPNTAVVLVAALGLLLRLGVGGAAGAAATIAAALALATPLAFAWKKGFCGAGDVKLAAAAACGVGAAGLLDFVLATGLAGGALSMAVLAVDRATRSSLRTSAVGVVLGTSTPRAAAPGAGRSVPYGVAIAVGAAYALWSGGIG